MPKGFKNVPCVILNVLYLGFMLFLSCCSKDPAIPPPNPVLPHVRKVLLEEFTGHFDGHGAIAADTILRIQNKYPGNVIAVTIHSGAFSHLFPPSYITDFHCNEGDDYFNFWGVTYNPVGTVNRIGYPNRILKDYWGEWGHSVDSLMLLPPVADIKITNHYNAGARVLTSSLRCEFLKSLEGTYKLVLLLTEDSIVASQKDYLQSPPYLVPDYVHRHILRDGITASWGDILKTGIIAPGEVVIKNYSYTLPVNFNGVVPDEDHCHMVAYIYNASTYEVLQAEEKRIK